MNFNKHSELTGAHAFLSASKYHWINYDEDKLSSAYVKFLATQRGTILHEFASQCINLKQKLPRSKKSLNAFVNDAIGFRMSSEQILYYSPNAFGTADAISFRDKLLRIHDLKTGVTPVSTSQLKIYAALFCLEYEINPRKIAMELRIYKSNEIVIETPDGKEIKNIMDKIVLFDKKIEKVKSEELED